MTPEDSYWLINNMVDRFPGLIDGEPVSGADLVEWISGQVNRDPLLAQIANGSVHRESTQDLAEVRWCSVCETPWRADPMEDE